MFQCKASKSLNRQSRMSIIVIQMALFDLTLCLPDLATKHTPFAIGIHRALVIEFYCGSISSAQLYISLRDLYYPVEI